MVELSLDSDDERRLDAIRPIVNHWLELEYANIVLRNLGIPIYSEWQLWQPNQLPGPARITYSFWNTVRGANISKLLISISPAVEALLLHLRHQNDFDRARAIVPLAQWLRDEKILGKSADDALRDVESQIFPPQTQAPA